jgi:class 3 adenylate cyclase
MRSDEERVRDALARRSGQGLEAVSIESTRLEYADLASALQFLRESTGGPLVSVAGCLARVHYLSGDLDTARSQLELWVSQWRREFVSPYFQFSLRLIQEVDDALTNLADDDTRAEIDTWLTSAPEARVGWLNGRALDHIRGDLARSLGRLDDATRWYRVGLEWAERERCPVEGGRNFAGLAEVAVVRGDMAAALDLFERAGERFSVGRAPTYVQRVLARRLELQGLSDTDPFTSIVAVSRAVQAEQPAEVMAAEPGGDVTIMFSDIEDSTALNEMAGDDAWMEVLHAHNALVEREVAAQGGRVVKTIGDGYMVVFGSAESAVRSALAIQAALATPPESLRDIRVRIGLHTGSVVAQGDDFFGREVNYAARVASAALGGEVLVSNAVRERCGAMLTTAAARDVEFKGFEGSQRVWLVSR